MIKKIFLALALMLMASQAQADDLSEMDRMIMEDFQSALAMCDKSDNRAKCRKGVMESMNTYVKGRGGLVKILEKYTNIRPDFTTETENEGLFNDHIGKTGNGASGFGNIPGMNGTPFISLEQISKPN